MKFSRPLHNEQGASVLFVLIAIPVMMVLVVLIIDIGQMVFARIRLQTTVDACALAAASRQSTGLNEITDLNNASVEEYQNAKKNIEGAHWASYGTALRSYKNQLRSIGNTIKNTNKKIKSIKKAIKVAKKNGDSTGRLKRMLNKLQETLKRFNGYQSMMGMVSAGLPWYNRSHLMSAYNYHKNVLDTIDKLKQGANKYFFQDAHRYAWNVKNRLMPEATLFSVGMVGRDELINKTQQVKSVRGRYWQNSCTSPKDCAVFIWGANIFKKPAPRFSECGASLAKLGRTAIPVPTNRRPGIGNVTKNLKVKWRKASSPETFAAYGLRQPQQSLILGNDLFDLRKSSLLAKLPTQYLQYIRNHLGPIALPEMTVYAAAKPTGGHIFNLKPEYRPMMVQLKSVPIKTLIPRGLFEH